jgi:secretion/DNA translocation related TadE-like protein
VVAGVAVLRGTATLARHRAETAADAAALAAAGQIGVSDDPCHRAAQIAAANRADLRNCRLNLTEDGRSGQVRVTVEFSISLPMVGLNTVLARARAERAPP